MVYAPFFAVGKGRNESAICVSTSQLSKAEASIKIVFHIEIHALAVQVGWISLKTKAV